VSAAPRAALAWPAGIAAVLCLLLSTSLALAWLAHAYPDPLVVSDAWQAERVLEADMRAFERARELGLALELSSSAGTGVVHVRARVTDRSGEPQRAARMSVRRERPAEGGLDAEIALAEGSEAWTGTIPIPRSGRWRLVARAWTSSGALLEQSLALEALP
jgi:nitrogen fixation protein FixH